MKRIITSSALLTITIVLFAACVVLAGVPQLINYQGRITDKNGAAVPDGYYDVEFKIYNVMSGGTALWTETWNAGTSRIKTTGGLFNAMLGTYSAIPDRLFSQNQTVYLGIKFGADLEMTPRQRITSVGYAFNAGNGVPSGAVTMWSGSITQIPAGWALCDGTNGTPDLRDRFIIGAGYTYAIGMTGGSTTKNLSHTHTGPSHTLYCSWDIYDHIGDTSDGADDGSKAVGSENHGHRIQRYTEAAGTGQTGAAGSASQDIMPPYFALAFIMKL